MSYEFRVPTLLPREEQQGENDMRDWLNRRHAERLLAAIPSMGDECGAFWPRTMKRPERCTNKVDFGRQRFTITCETGHVLDFQGHLNLTFFQPALKDNCEPIAARIEATSDGFCNLLIPDHPRKRAPQFVTGQVVVITKPGPHEGELRLISEVGAPQPVLYLKAGSAKLPEMWLACDVKLYEAGQ